MATREAAIEIPITADASIRLFALNRKMSNFSYFYFLLFIRRKKLQRIGEKSVAV